MAPRGQELETEGRLARLETAMASLAETVREDRGDAKADRKDILSKLDGLQQTSMSTQQTVSRMALEKCGERLDGHDAEIAAVKLRLAAGDAKFSTRDELLQNWPDFVQDMLFWRRLLGGGVNIVWRLIALVGGAGGISALITWMATRHS